jgi:Mor family transcriptional regulator
MNDTHTPTFLETLTVQIVSRLKAKHAFSQASAAEFGLEVAEEMRRLWGGLSVYICKNEKKKVKKRRIEIYEDYLKGGITPALCRKFGLTEQRIRQIITTCQI